MTNTNTMTMTMTMTMTNTDPTKPEGNQLSPVRRASNSGTFR
ncbi:MAG TPA: hypothetical protein V6C72_08345 [Chroococcales cyanobacterium]